MLYTTTVDDITLAILKELMAEKSLDDFVLVGGTALALQIGHRKSVVFDTSNTWPVVKSKITEVIRNFG